jgi:hypothetical protein
MLRALDDRQSPEDAVAARPRQLRKRQDRIFEGLNAHQYSWRIVWCGAASLIIHGTQKKIAASFTSGRTKSSC